LSQDSVEIATHGPEKAITGTWYNSLLDDLERLAESIKEFQPDYVMHLAGIAVTSDYSLYYRVNTQYAANLLRAMELAGMEEIPTLLIGTSAEYGQVSTVDLPITEDLPCNPYNHYGISKLAQTGLGLELARRGRPIVTARPFNIIGPGMSPNLVVQTFARQIIDIKEGRQAPVIKVGNLASTRDFIDVYQVVDIYWEMVQNPTTYGSVINVCTGKPVTIQSILNRLIEIGGVKIDVEVDPARVKGIDVPNHYGSTERLARLTGVVPELDLTKTLQDILNQIQIEVSR
jgi:GDP-4-dehydro-6-deoxy-D-mannose reductase